MKRSAWFPRCRYLKKRGCVRLDDCLVERKGSETYNGVELYLANPNSRHHDNASWIQMLDMSVEVEVDADPQAREVLMEESNVQPVRCPVTVCGDIHGQFVCPSHH